MYGLPRYLLAQLRLASRALVELMQFWFQLVELSAELRRQPSVRTTAHSLLLRPSKYLFLARTNGERGRQLFTDRCDDCGNSYYLLRARATAGTRAYHGSRVWCDWFRSNLRRRLFL